MKNLFILLFLSTLLLSTCQQKTKRTIYVLNEEVNIKFNKTISLKNEDLKITFIEITDSRCPKNTQCVWEGEGLIRLQIQKENQSKVVGTKVKGLCFDKNGDCGESLEVFGYQIKILSLSPYPKSNYPVKGKYQITFLISKK